jgi:hypothetical protein
MSPLALGAGRRPRSQKFAFAAVVVMGGVLFVAGLVDLRKTQLLKAEGVAARGTVTGKHRTGGRSKSYYLDLEFPNRDGQRVTVSASVSRGRFERTRPGETVPLHYLPRDPTVIKVGAQPQLDSSWFFMSVAAFLCCGVYWLFALWRGNSDAS